MKDLNSFVNKYLNKKEKHKKQFAAVVSLSMLVSFAVPMVLQEPAMAKTKDSFTPVSDILSAPLFNANNGMINSVAEDNTLSQKQLLVGDGCDWAEGLTTADEVIAAAKKKYLLGIASDFCLFLEGDFDTKQADCEGRAAIGGNVRTECLTFDYNTNSWKGYNYQFGDGDYGHNIALTDLEEYKGLTNYASLITNGTIWRVHVKGEKGTDKQKAKRLFVNGFNDTDCRHVLWDSQQDVPYAQNCSCGNGNERSRIYKDEEPLINFATEFQFMRQQSKAIEKARGVNAVIDTANKTVTFDAGEGCTDEVVYFNLDADTLGNFGGYTFNFINIPNIGGTVTKLDGSEIPKIANIIINVKGENINIGDTSSDTTKIVHTYINDIRVSNSGSNSTNNHVYSSNLLYNFVDYNDGTEKELNINANFNGTILAPDANVKSDPNQCAGHLSGSLIAKSFEGGMEFGYRPYRGTVDILPSSSGYGVPIRKIIKGSNNTPLTGAAFGIFEKNGEEEKLVTTFTSDENGEGYVNIPSNVDFSGETDYKTKNNTITTEYIIKETKAPSGFVIDEDKSYSVTVQEVVDRDSVMEFDGNIPTKVTTTITSTYGGITETFVIDLNDIYSFVESVGGYRRIRRELKISQGNGTSEETFYIDMNGSTGEIKSVSRNDGIPVSTDENEKIEVKTTGTEYNTSITSYYTTAETVYQKDENGTTIVGEDGNPIPETSIVTETVDTSMKNSIYKIIWCHPGVGSQSSIYINKLKVFYEKDGQGSVKEYTGFNNSGNSGETGYWEEISLPNDFEKDNIIGLEFELAGNFDDTTEYKLAFQNSSWTTYGEMSFKKEDLTSDKMEHSQLKVPVTYKDGETTFSLSHEIEKPVTIVYETSTEKEVTTYDIGGPVLSIYAPIIADPKSKTTYTTTVDDISKVYQYDPETVMMMPMPSNVPVFENAYGLNFMKLSKSGDADAELLEGAEITVKKVSDGSEVKTNILDGDSSATIDLKDIEENETYYFEEINAPSGHEFAEKIYFRKSGTTITYSQNENLSNPQTVDLTKNNTDTPQAISMVDIKKSGAVIKLEKTNKEFTERLAGSEFKLYVKKGNDKILVYPTDDSTFEIPETGIDLYETFKQNTDKVNGEYIKDGYLVEGLYYLSEEKAPENYNKADGFEFRVKKDGDNYIIEPVAVGTASYIPIELEWGGDNHQQAWIKTEDGVLKQENQNAHIDNVVSYEIKLANGQIPKVIMRTVSGEYIPDKSDNKFTFDSPTSLNKFEIQNNSGWNRIDIEEITITTADGTIYKYEGNSSGGSGSSGETVDSYKIGDILYSSSANKNLSGTMIFYYSTGDSKSQNIEIIDSPNNDGWDEFKISVSKENVIGIKIDVTSGSSATMIIRKDGDNGNGIMGTEGWSYQLQNGTSTFGSVPETASLASAFKVVQTLSFEEVAEVEEARPVVASVGRSVLKLSDIKSLTQKSSSALTKNTNSNSKSAISGNKIKSTNAKTASQTYNIGQMAFSNNGGSSSIEIIFYYSNGSSKTVYNNTISTYYTDLCSYITESKNDVVGISLKLTGSDATLNCADYSKSPQNFLNCTITESTPVTFGDTSGTGSTDPEPDPSSSTTTTTIITTTTTTTIKPDENTKELIISDNNSNQPTYKTKDGNNINNAKYIYIESNDPQEIKLYGAGSWNDTKIKSGENKNPANGNLATFNEIKLSTTGKWDQGFEVTYIRITTENGEIYTYGSPKGTVPEPSGESTTTTTTQPAVTTPTNTTAVTTAGLQAVTTVNSDGETILQLPNEMAGDKMDVTVEKVWASDERFTSLRADEIEVKLERYLDDGTTKDNDFTVPENVTLKSSNNWKASWSDLDRNYTDNGEKKTYVYKVTEITEGNAKLVNYNTEYSSEGKISASGKIEIKNTLKTIDINIEKKWTDGQNQAITNDSLLPAEVQVKLQYKNNNVWTDIDNGTYTLTSAENWTTEINNLPEIYEYRIVELNVPNGWIVQDNNDTADKDDKSVSITNKQVTGSLEIDKIWKDNNAVSGRPDSISVELYRSTKSPVSASTSIENHPTTEQTENYAKLLQYSLYFYDANMCGNEVGEKSAVTWRDDCHTYSEVDGGFHDAGDHVMFGLPQGFTASTLGWNYYEFKESFDSLGQTDHYQKIMKYFCDFFVKSIKEENGTTKILVQKGDGGTDHGYWGSPEKQGINNFTNNVVDVWKSSSGGDIAAEYAAALAQYYINFPDDPDRDTYLSKAKEFYNYAVKYPKYDEASAFYNSSSLDDDLAWAAGWLYRATGNEDYLNKLNSYNKIDWLYNWNNVDFGVACLKAELNNDWSSVNEKIDELFKNGTKIDNGKYICLNDWGSTRYNTLMQFIALVSDKYNKTNTYTQLCKDQMAYILGDNNIQSNGNSSTCFITGFADNSASHAHHRGASVNKSGNYTNKLVGALVGGPNTASQYYDEVETSVKGSDGNSLSYQVNEVALDYNSGLVGAAAGLYYFTGNGTLADNAALQALTIDATKYDQTPIKVKNYTELVVPKVIEDNEDSDMLSIGDERKLVLENSTDDVEWSVDKSGIVNINDDILTAIEDGVVTIQAKVNNVLVARYTLNVKIASVVPDIENMEIVDTIKLEKDAWSATKTNLPLYSPDGKQYYYYIKEKTTIDNTVAGKGCTYYSIAYTNGVNLSVSDTAKVDVTNKKVETGGAIMPSAGGKGTTGYYFAGAFIIGIAGAFWFIRRRRISD